MTYYQHGWIARVLSVCCIVIALVTILGYAFNQPGLYHWPGMANGIGMAINTALCIILLSCAMVLLSLRKP